MTIEIVKEFPDPIIISPSVNEDGSIWVTQGDTICKWNPDGTLTDFIGMDQTGEPYPWKKVDGPIATAKFKDLSAILQGPDGTLYVGDGNCIRVIKDGQVSTLAGGGNDPDNRDGVGADVYIGVVDALWFDTDGRLLFTDEGTLRTIAMDGTVTTIADVEDDEGLTPGNVKDSDGNQYYLYNNKSFECKGKVVKRKPDGAEECIGRDGTADEFSSSVAYDLTRKILYYSSGYTLLKVTEINIPIPEGQEDVISMTAIPDGTRMVDFHGERAKHRYYTEATYNALNPKKNPYTRQAIEPNQVTRYIAKLDSTLPVQEAGRRRKTRKSKRRAKKTRRRHK